MPEQFFKTTSGLEVTVHIGEDGEPEKVSWEVLYMDNNKRRVELSELDVRDIQEYIDDIEIED